MREIKINGINNLLATLDGCEGYKKRVQK